MRPADARTTSLSAASCTQQAQARLYSTRRRLQVLVRVFATEFDFSRISIFRRHCERLNGGGTNCLPRPRDTSTVAAEPVQHVTAVLHVRFRAGQSLCIQAPQKIRLASCVIWGIDLHFSWTNTAAHTAPLRLVTCDCAFSCTSSKVAASTRTRRALDFCSSPCSLARRISVCHIPLAIAACRCY